MKNFKKLAMLGAVALTSTVLFTACSADEEVANVNPTFDGKAVKTSFTLSVGDVKNTTRMTADAVQEDELFNGMTDIYLFPAKAAIEETTAFSEGYLNLPAFAQFDMTSGANGKLYNDVSFSIGVSHFLFYAASSTKDNGELKPSYLKMDNPAWSVTHAITTTSTPANITFDLVPWQKGKAFGDIWGTTTGTEVLAALNAISAKLKEQYDASVAASATDEKLNTEYTKMQNYDGTNYLAFAGSALSVKAMMEDLYNALKVTGASTYAEAVATEIATYFTITGSDVPYTLTKWTSENTFPNDSYLPDGSVGVKWNNSSSKFEAATASVEGLNVAAISNYTHPARLYYWKNTSALVKNATWLNTNKTAEDWETVIAAYTDGTAITAATQSVIMKDQVEYAVGRLDVKTRVNNEVVILDNGSGITDAADKDPQPVAVPSEGYTVTGILIGGQKQVGWNFEPKSSATEMTIWDNNVKDKTNAAVAAKSLSDFSTVNPVYTLALETEANTSVNVAIEFLNTGNDFYGVNNKLIPHGTKFYLIASLNPAGKARTKVFEQDYTTTATLTIGENSLKSAYNVVPDLRSPKLEFGLSVNLEWKAGVTYDQEFN